MQVGFIGLGNMGSGMAANLLKAGHALTVYSLLKARRSPRRQGRLRAAMWSSLCWPTMLRSKARYSAQTASSRGLRLSLFISGEPREQGRN
jgi:hypothetical protein